MAYEARFRCVLGCEGSHPLDQVIYQCPRCGELLEVVHDLEALRERSADGWKQLFDSRWNGLRATRASGVWNKKEWVAPGVREECIVSMGEGASHLYPAERYGSSLGLSNVLIKHCGNSHTGSFKDLGMTVLVSVVRQMIMDGAPIRAIACASTGDTSAALAAYCAAAGIRAVVLLPKGKISTAQLVQPLAHGALVLALDTDFDGCMTLVQRLAREPGVYLANSMNSLRLEGQKTVALEMCQQLDWQVPDWVMIPGGNLGNVSALGAGFEMMRALGLISKRPRICVAQAERANPLYRAFERGLPDELVSMEAQPTEASAIRIGNPVSYRRAVRVLKDFDGVVEQASEEELACTSAAADRSGLYVCPQTSVALAALQKLVHRGEIEKDARVVVVSTANALKFTDFKVRYHEGTLGHKPVELSANYEDVKRAVLTGLDQG